MSLLEKANIVNNNPEETKKSILPALKNSGLAKRIDIFIIIVLFILIVTPIVTNLFIKAEAAAKHVNLYLSEYSEDLFGKRMMEELLLEFEEIYPDIKIKFINNSAATAAANTNATATVTVIEPDIYLFTDGDFNLLAANDSLAELSIFTNYDSGSPQLAIPLVSFMDLLFYNIDLLTRAGFGSPPKSRDEFIAYARTVSRGDFDAAGAAISLSSDDRQAVSRDIFSWIWASGGNFWLEGDKPLLNSRTVINDITFIGLLNRDRVFAPDIFETTGDQRLDQFAQGKIALMISSARAIPYLREKMGDDAFGVTTIPDSGTGGRYSVNISAIYAGINANTDYPQEAWIFLEFLAERSPLINAELKAIPGVISDIIPGDYVKNDPFYAKAWDIFESAEIAENFIGKQNAEQYENIFLEELQIFFETTRTAQATINVIQQRWNAVE